MFPDFAPIGSHLLSDPSALRLFGVGADVITVLDTGGQRNVPIQAIDTGVRPVLSSDGRDLFVARFRTDGGGPGRVYHVDVLDPLTGAERRTLPELPPGLLTSMAVSSDRQRLMLTFVTPVAVRVMDATSGVELISRGPLWTNLPPGEQEGLGDLLFDDRTNRLFVSSGPSPTFADPRKLFILSGSLNVASVVDGAPAMAADRTQGLVVTLATSFGRPFGCTTGTAYVWNSSTTPLQSFPAPARGCPELVVATPPDPPVDLKHTVDGRRVTFSWSSVPGVAGYILEAGSTPGSTNLGRIQTSLPAFEIAGVPPGTYYVSVRALNDVGTSDVRTLAVVNVP